MNKIDLWNKIRREIKNCKNHGQVWTILNTYIKEGKLNIEQAGKVIVWWHNNKIKGIKEHNPIVTEKDFIGWGEPIE